MTIPVGVVGAGITGLALSHFLAEEGVPSITYERSTRVGGVIRTREVDGIPVECGPQRLRITDAVDDLVVRMGLEDELIVADDSLPLYVYAAGRLRPVPRSVRGLIHTDLLSIRGKLRLVAEPFVRRTDSGATAAELFVRRFGREAYRNLIEPLYGGIYGSDPGQMPARHGLTGRLDLAEGSRSLLVSAIGRSIRGGATSPAGTFRSGLSALPRALYEAHADRIELGRPVVAVRDHDDGFVLETDAGSVVVERVIVTTPADTAAELLAPVAPSASRLAELTYNPLAIVHLVGDHGRTGLGYQVRRDEPLRTLGVTWNGSAFGRDALNTCFLGGMYDPDILTETDDRISSIAVDEFRSVTGVAARPIEVVRLPRAFPAYDDSWDRLDGLSLPDGISLATNYTGRTGIPSRIAEAASIARRIARA